MEISRKIELEKDATFHIYESLGDFSLSDEQFEELWGQHPKEKEKVKVFGKVYDMPRFVRTYGKDYTFSNVEHHADALDSIVVSGNTFLLDAIDYLEKHRGVQYNQVLINWYQDGQHYIGAHSDDEKQFDNDTVLCFNYCKRSRDIVLTSKNKEKKQRIVHSMSNNTGYEMYGKNFQKNYKHAVPKRAVKFKDERRISLTFRVFK